MIAEIDKLAWLHIVGRRVLFARSIGKQACYLPGGKREPGESDEAALIREIREELTVSLIPSSLQFAGEFQAQADGKRDGTIVRLRCYRAGFEGDVSQIKPAAEIEQVLWLAYDSRQRCSPVGRIILDWLKDKDLID